MKKTAEKNQNLWMLAFSPIIWAAHFLLSYLSAAIWCAKFAGPDRSLVPIRLAIAAYTVAALAGISVTAWKGYRRHEHGAGTIPHDFDTPEARHQFIGFATLLLSGLSAVAVAYVALNALFFSHCH